MPHGIFTGLNIVTGKIRDEILASAFADQTASGPWRPPEWAAPALTAITAPVQQPAVASQNVDPVTGAPMPGAPSFAGTQVYVFDAVFKVDHARDLRTTEHPIQTNASSPVQYVTDHAYQLPARVTLEIGMSDAMDSYDASVWTSNTSKSVSAFQTLVSLQKNRTLLQLTTRLDTYTGMLIESIRPSDTVKTLHGLRATVTFKKIFLASISKTRSPFPATPDDDAVAASPSARAQTTDSTALGIVQPLPVPPALAAQHNITSTAAAPILAPTGSMLAAPAYRPLPGLDYDIPGAGNWSSGGLGGAVGGAY